MMSPENEQRIGTRNAVYRLLEQPSFEQRLDTRRNLRDMQKLKEDESMLPQYERGKSDIFIIHGYVGKVVAAYALTSMRLTSTEKLDFTVFDGMKECAKVKVKNNSFSLEINEPTVEPHVIARTYIEALYFQSGEFGLHKYRVLLQEILSGDRDGRTYDSGELFMNELTEDEADVIQSALDRFTKRNV